MYSRILLAAGAASLFLSTVSAQAPAFRSPGMPSARGRGVEDTQSTRFSTEFNPAISFIVDAIADYRSLNGASEDGFDAEMRTLELGAQAWIDPRAWAYFIAATEGEEVAVEEAAVHYVGFEGNSTLRAGRFFIDFGKQMQTHVHELRTVERPVALRALLGTEVKGDGLQWDHWTPVTDDTVVRWSVGAFRSLLPEEDEFFPDPERSVEDRKDFGDLNFTARLTALTEVSDRGTLQLGASARFIPSYGVEFSATGDTQAELSNAVYGLDATYECRSETGQEVLTLGAEGLIGTGDTGVENPTPGTIRVLDDSLLGYYVFADLAWTLYDSAGVQYSAVELGDADQSRVGEVEVYYTRHLSEYQRLRFGLGTMGRENGEDSARAVVQYTAILGAHGHGLNW